MKLLDSIIFLYEKKSFSKIAVQKKSQKISQIDSLSAVGFAGISSDALLLRKRMEKYSDNHFCFFGNRPGPFLIAKNTAIIQQQNTFKGGQRPFGVSCVTVGFDTENECFRIFHSDPSGNFGEFDGIVIGNNSGKGNIYLQKEYNENLNIKEGIELGINCMNKILEFKTDYFKIISCTYFSK